MTRNTALEPNGALFLAGGLILPRLKVLGVDQVFINSGTDFPPIIEGLAEASFKGIATADPILVPHEHAALGMAYGNYKLTRKPQAVILHTNVGLANAATGIINAACENIPIIVMSGRTPVTEKGRFGSRTVPIGWGQEMFDQASLIREACKWEYEVRFPEQLMELMDRAYAIANSTPKGPVYLSLPREVISMEVENNELFAKPKLAPFQTSPSMEEIDTLCEWLEESATPLLITQRDVEDKTAFITLDALVENYGIAVCTWWATGLAVSTENPCHIGSDPQTVLVNSDLIIVLNSPAPWWPDQHKVASHAKIANLGPDPIFANFPLRNFRSDLTIAGEVAAIISSLNGRLQERDNVSAEVVRQRISNFKGPKTKKSARARAIENSVTTGLLTKQAVSAVLGEILSTIDATVFSELGADLDLLSRTEPDSWFQEPYSGGLGWSFPAALGAKLAKPEKLIMAVMGDGSYLFSNPTVCHQVAEALHLPILITVLNNSEWGAVKNSVLEMFPEGYASRMNKVPLTSLEPSPDYCTVASASNAWARRVKEFSELRATLLEAIDVTRNENRTALIDIAITSTDQ